MLPTKLSYTWVAALSWVVWAVSLLLPAVTIDHETFLGKSTSPMVIRGWEALQLSILSPAEISDGRRWVFVELMGLTNLIMVLSPVAVFAKSDVGRRALIVLALAATGLNASAYLWLGPELREAFAAGYWVWLASFALLALTVWIASRQWRTGAERSAAMGAS